MIVTRSICSCTHALENCTCVCSPFFQLNKRNPPRSANTQQCLHALASFDHGLPNTLECFTNRLVIVKYTIQALVAESIVALIVKSEHLTAAESIFASTSIQITAQGQRHLGAALGTRSFTEAYVTQKVATWTAEVTALAGVASTRPHAAYCAFTHGMIGH